MLQLFFPAIQNWSPCIKLKPTKVIIIFLPSLSNFAELSFSWKTPNPICSVILIEIPFLLPQSTAKFAQSVAVASFGTRTWTTRSALSAVALTTCTRCTAAVPASYATLPHSRLPPAPSCYSACPPSSSCWPSRTSSTKSSSRSRCHYLDRLSKDY